MRRRRFEIHNEPDLDQRKSGCWLKASVWVDNYLIRVSAVRHHICTVHRPTLLITVLYATAEPQTHHCDCSCMTVFKCCAVMLQYVTRICHAVAATLLMPI